MSSTKRARAWCVRASVICSVAATGSVHAQSTRDTDSCRPDIVTEQRSSRGSAYQVEGCGPPMLLLHGFSADRRMWRELVKQWRLRFRLVLVDLKSHGASVAATSADNVMADIVAILDEQHLPSAIVIGHSAGAAIAVDLALQSPTRVTALVLLAPSVTGFTSATSVDMRTVATHVRTGDLAAAMEAWLTLPLMQTTLDSADAATFRAMIRENARVWNARAPRPISSQPALDRIATLCQPIFIGVGDRDASAAFEVARAIKAVRPDAELHTFSKGGHWFPVEAPTDVGAAITSFLQRSLNSARSASPPASSCRSRRPSDDRNRR